MLRLSRSSLVLHDLSICPHEIRWIVVGRPARDTRSLKSRLFWTVGRGGIKPESGFVLPFRRRRMDRSCLVLSLGWVPESRCPSTTKETAANVAVCGGWSGERGGEGHVVDLSGGFGRGGREKVVKGLFRRPRVVWRVCLVGLWDGLERKRGKGGGGQARVSGCCDEREECGASGGLSGLIWSGLSRSCEVEDVNIQHGGAAVWDGAELVASPPPPSSCCGGLGRVW